uniref:DUF4220 domain-containing protein n=1 Tax=Aegilops tauschii subsp. strangulata TaxID=200361 RepID=A0A452XM63_AEGTS
IQFMDDFNPKTPSFCRDDASAFFFDIMVAQLWRVNALIAVNAILMGVMVGISMYGHRYHRRPLIFIFQGATTLFLPIVSYVVSTTGDQSIIAAPFHSGVRGQDEIVIGRCDTTEHISRVLVWTALVQIVGINTTAIIATDAREGRKFGPPVVLLVQAVWTSYLAVYNAGYQGSLGLYHRVLKEDDARHAGPVGYNKVWSMENVVSLRGFVVVSLFALIFAKLILKCYAWYMGRRSLVLGRNPRVIFGYMEQLHDGNHPPGVVGEHIPPLIIMGEDTLLLEKQSYGYSFKNIPRRGDETRVNNNGLVTLDKIWQFDSMSLRLTPQLKDLCLSLALFKLLRCRFAKYTIADAGFMKVSDFLWDMLLKASDDERFLGLIENELSFLHDCYYSSLPISFAKSWLPILSIFISLLSIGCCLVTTIVMFPLVLLNGGGYQLMCLMHCNSPDHEIDMRVGNLYHDLAPVCLLFALVVLTEVREIASYVYSNWTKVAIICRFVQGEASLRKYPTLKKFVDHVLHHRCKLLRHWNNKMNQCSILVLHRRRIPVVFLQRLIHLPDQHSEKVPRAVKTIIVETLRSYGRSRNNSVIYLRRSIQLQVDDNLLWTVSNAGTADSILVCHIATSIFEVRSQPQSHQPLSDHKVAAIHLSRYCVYLVAYHPELLPDDDDWCKSLYKDVKKDADRLQSGSVATTPMQLIKLLSTKSKHEVLKNGALLGGQLAEMVESEEMVWKALAKFWSELILYVSPSDNMDGQAEAIFRGGELITLLWMLQTHLGIVSRPGNSGATTDVAPPV